jgi:hypothetical protein
MLASVGCICACNTLQLFSLRDTLLVAAWFSIAVYIGQMCCVRGLGNIDLLFLPVRVVLVCQCRICVLCQMESSKDLASC